MMHVMLIRSFAFMSPVNLLSQPCIFTVGHIYAFRQAFCTVCKLCHYTVASVTLLTVWSLVVVKKK